MDFVQAIGRDAEILGSLIISAVLTGMLGWERERMRRAAGLRTHMLLGLTATLIMAMGPELVTDHGATEALDGDRIRLTYDPARLIEAIVAGVSFIGAGTIFVARRDHVRGLTTATSLLAAASVGVVVGLGRIVVAAAATGLVLIILAVLRHIEPAAPHK